MNNELAHPGSRFQAQFIDGLVSLVIFGVCIYIASKLGISDGAASIFSILPPFLYFILSDALPNGQSIGKKVISISVVSKSTRKPCTPAQSVLRNILTPILGAIDAVLIFGKSRQRIGDKIANTIVIKPS